MSNINKKKEKEKKMQDKYQAILSRLLREEDNKYCIDCDAKGPRWASWNLGIFLCIRCAGIHRNLGVHISRVKSVNLDSWTEEQIHSMEDTGNTVGRKLYEGNLPSGYRRPQTDSKTSALEQFIRGKYEHKRYIDKNYVKPPVRHTEFEDPEKEKRRKTKGKTISIQKPAESSENTSAAKTQAQAKPAPVAAAVARPTTNQSLTVQQTAPQKSVSLPTTPVSRRKAAVDDLLGLDTPPASQDLLGMNTPQGPTGQSSSSNNVATNSAEISLFGDDAETPKSAKGGTKNKDSIMALYGSGTRKQPAYGVPGGMYIPAQGQQQPQQVQQPTPQQYNGYPNNVVPVANPGMGMMGNQQGMMGTNQSMMGQQQGMMGRQQQGMMPMAGIYNAQAQQQQQQQAYLNQPANQQQQVPQQQQQIAPIGQTQPQMGLGQQGQSSNFHMMSMQQQYQHPQQPHLQQNLQQQQLQQPQLQQQNLQQQQWQYMQKYRLQQQQQQQIQQQMKSLQVGTPGLPHVSSCPQFSPALQQQAAGVPAAGNSMGGWGTNNGSGQTLSTNLWK